MKSSLHNSRVINCKANLGSHIVLLARNGNLSLASGKGAHRIITSLLALLMRRFQKYVTYKVFAFKFLSKGFSEFSGSSWRPVKRCVTNENAAQIFGCNEVLFTGLYNKVLAPAARLTFE